MRLPSLVLLLGFVLLLLSCSPTKRQPYYFDYYSYVPVDKNLQKENNLNSIGGDHKSNDYYALVEETSLLEASSLMASTSEEVVTLVDKPTEHKAKRVIKAIVKSETKARTKKGDSSKNGFAIAGFITSIAGILIWPLFIVGVVLSAIGLKSEKRGFAIAGLIIGIAGVLLLTLVVLAFFRDFNFSF